MSCRVLVGADGASSVLAQQLGLPQPKYAGYVAYRWDPSGPALPSIDAYKRTCLHRTQCRQYVGEKETWQLSVVTGNYSAPCH
jgi:flavin-dependent dehydrogenase